MSSFAFKKIESFKSPDFIQRGFVLWIWYADKIPPHIGCSVNNFYFSLKVNGKDENMHVGKVLSIVYRKKIPMLFIQIIGEYEVQSLQAIFSMFKSAESTKNSCLSPINLFLNCPKKILQLSDLLKYLEENKQIESVFGLNLADSYKGIPSYTKEDIENRLRNLENAKSQKNISSVG